MSDTSNSTNPSSGLRSPAVKKWQESKVYLLPEHIMSFLREADFGPVYAADGNVVEGVTFQQLLSCLGGELSESPGVATGVSYHGIIRKLFLLYVLRNSPLKVWDGIGRLKHDKLFMTHFSDVIAQYNESKYRPFTSFSDDRSPVDDDGCKVSYIDYSRRMNEFYYLLSFTHHFVKDMDEEQKGLFNAYGKKTYIGRNTQLFSEEGQAMLAQEDLGDEKHMLYASLLMNTIKKCHKMV